MFFKSSLGRQRDWQYCSAVLVNHTERQVRELLSESGEHSIDISAFVSGSHKRHKGVIKTSRRFIVWASTQGHSWRGSVTTTDSCRWGAETQREVIKEKMWLCIQSSPLQFSRSHAQSLPSHGRTSRQTALTFVCLRNESLSPGWNPKLLRHWNITIHVNLPCNKSLILSATGLQNPVADSLTVSSLDDKHLKHLWAPRSQKKVWTKSLFNCV